MILHYAIRSCHNSQLTIHATLVAAFLLITSVSLSAQDRTSPVYPAMPEIFSADPSQTPITGSLIQVHGGEDLQAAINQAQPGDALILDAGATWTGNFTLPNKAGTGWITIESSEMADLPAWGTRVSPSDASNMPAIRSNSATAAISIADGAHNYRLQGLNISVAAHARLSYGVIVEKLDPSDTNDRNTPSHIIFDRDYVHGAVLCQCKFGIQLNAHYIAVDNSYLSEFHGLGQDTQALTGYANVGPVQIVNNFLEGSGENVIFGGAYDAIPNAIASDIEIRNNYFYKPPVWRGQIIAPPANVEVAPLQGGNFTPGVTYYYKIVATGNIGYYSKKDQSDSPGSKEVAFTADATNQSATVSWTKATYGDNTDFRTPDQYLVLRTTDPPKAKSRTWHGYNFFPADPNAATITYIDDGGRNRWTTTSDPANWGTHWAVKNLLEFKNGIRILVDGNVFENCWVDAQGGVAIVMTPRTENTGSVEMANHTIQDVTFTNNLVRHAGGGITLSSVDNYANPARLTLIQPPARILFANNIWDDISWAYGGAQFWTFEAGINGVGGAANVIFDHNTVFQDYNFLGIQSPSQPSENFGPFFLTNNIFPNNQYGIAAATGRDLSKFSAMFSSLTVSRNVWIGGEENWPGNFYPPSVSQVGFVNYNSGDNGNYQLAPVSPYRGQATDGTDPGANIDTLTAATAAAQDGGSTAAYPGRGQRSADNAQTIFYISSSSVRATSARISWATSEASSGVVFGPTPSYGTTVAADQSGANPHIVSLRELRPATTYHFAITSTGSGGTMVSPDQTFTTSPKVRRTRTN